MTCPAWTTWLPATACPPARAASLDTYAHLTPFHEGDAAFAHLHPTTKVSGDNGGPDLSFHAELPTSGNWRLFLQFQTGGKLHTAALTPRVG
ncbi:hypothetical protein [Streptomyces sp. NPDC004685]